MVTLKNKTSRIIIEKLRSKKEKIQSKDEIIKTLKDYEKIYKIRINYISIWTYLRKDKYIKRILGDFYYVYSIEERYKKYCNYSEQELIFFVLEKMNIKWYLGLESALKQNKIIWQALNIVIIINNHFSGIKKLGNSKFKFIKTKEKRFNFGLIRKKTNNNVTYFYSDLEKTYLDFLYFFKKNNEAVKKNLDFALKNSVLKKYSKAYSKKIQEAL